jgi:hypothetical protein
LIGVACANAWSTSMEILYSILMSGVLLAILASLYEAIRGVTRKPVWETAGVARQSQPEPVAAPVVPELRVVHTEDRRTQHLPFVGPERRKSAQQPEPLESLEKAS